MEGVGDFLSDVLVGGDGGGDIEGFEGDFYQVEIEALQQAHLLEGSLDHILGGGQGGIDFFGQTTRIHPDADGHTSFFGGFDHGFYSIRLADVARVEAEAVNACLQRRQSQAVIEVDIGD